MKKYAVAALGELLVDFTQAGVSPSGMRLYEQNPGGAPANVLCLAARQSLKTAFIGKVGNDMHGRFLSTVLEREGIDTCGLAVAENAYTTLAFVSIDENGEREFSFSRSPGADTTLRADELCEDVLKSCRIFHFGSLSLTAEPSRSATFCAARIAAAAGAVISYDPNYRAALWKSTGEAVEMMRRPLDFANVVKLSAEEAVLITGKADLKSAAEAILSAGVRLVVITNGAKEALFAYPGGFGSCSAFELGHAVDTTGAGDAFWGAMLSRLSAFDAVEDFLPDIEEHVRFSHAAAALCVSKRGAIPAMPYKSEIENFLKDRRK